MTDPSPDIKRAGRHFTPPELAGFVARRVATLLEVSDAPIRVLDPSCGDGSLLLAMLEALPKSFLPRTTIVGIDQDSGAIDAAQKRLRDRRDQHREWCEVQVHWHHCDFLQLETPLAACDIVIANPPYVRTQVLGAAYAQALAAKFNLSGRIDLYQAFLVEIAKHLKPGGVLGAITSNRFFTTKGGQVTREFLRQTFDIEHLIDLGDTKLFSAAVLPALIFARRRRKDAIVSVSTPTFTRIYQQTRSTRPSLPSQTSVLDYCEAPKCGSFSVGQKHYQVSTGELIFPKAPRESWTLLESAEASWVRRIDAQAAHRLGDVAKVRVGIKTTADSVFIRSDWDTLPAEQRPEEEYLKPIVAREDAGSYIAQQAKTGKKVLITHQVVDGKRRAIKFPQQSAAWQYLLKNRERLEQRRYVLNVGRCWYEIWVPQDPNAWALNKLVYPDISAGPQFFFDSQQSVVNGNCYWITLRENMDPLWLPLLLGLCNSSVLSRYHDLAFQNRLYSGRRRHLTQYVSRYPLPSLKHPAAKEIACLVQEFLKGRPSTSERDQLRNQVNRLAEQCFDLSTANT